jgi:hypothetical protein
MSSYCNSIILPCGDTCSRKNKPGAELCGFHLKREEKACPRIQGLCNHIYKESRCKNPSSGNNEYGLCSKHEIFIQLPPIIEIIEGNCCCKGEHHCGVRL